MFDKKVIGYGVRKKKCSLCQNLNRNNIAVTGAHMQKCNVNIHGSSSSSEIELEFALVLTQKVFTDSGGNTYVLYIVSDDAPSMRYHL